MPAALGEPILKQFLLWVKRNDLAETEIQVLRFMKATDYGLELLGLR
jgi:hypothetical protein